MVPLMSDNEKENVDIYGMFVQQSYCLQFQCETIKPNAILNLQCLQ